MTPQNRPKRQECILSNAARNHSNTICPWQIQSTEEAENLFQISPEKSADMSKLEDMLS
jgi:hypothetical protein